MAQDSKPGTMRVSSWRQYRALLLKDLRQEVRTREMLTSMVVYALLVLIVYGAALLTATALTRLKVVNG